MQIPEKLLGELVREATQSLKGFKRAPREAQQVFIRCCTECARKAVSEPGARVTPWRELVGEEQIGDIAEVVRPYGVKPGSARGWVEAVLEVVVISALKGFHSIDQLREERRRSDLGSSQPDIPFFSLSRLGFRTWIN